MGPGKYEAGDGGSRRTKSLVEAYPNTRNLALPYWRKPCCPVASPLQGQIYQHLEFFQDIPYALPKSLNNPFPPIKWTILFKMPQESLESILELTVL